MNVYNEYTGQSKKLKTSLTVVLIIENRKISIIFSSSELYFWPFIHRLPSS